MVRQSVVIAVTAALALVACSGASEADARAATAAQLETHLDTAWMPTDAELWQALTDPPPCSLDCPPVAISWSFFCTCDDLADEMVTMQDRVAASGFEIVEPFSPTTGRFVGRHPDDEIDRGFAWVAVVAIADALELEPANTALQGAAKGRAAISVTLSAEDPGTR